MLFSAQRIWSFFLFFLFALSLGFVSKLFLNAYGSLRCTQKVKMESLEPLLVKNYRGYQLKVRFFYSYQGHSFQGSQALNQLFYKNQEAALDDFRAFSKKQSWVYVDSKKPQRALVIKQIPFKKIFYSLLSLSIFIYFWVLGRKFLKLRSF